MAISKVHVCHNYFYCYVTYLEENSLDETFDFGDGTSPTGVGEDSNNEESTDVSTNNA